MSKASRLVVIDGLILRRWERGKVRLLVERASKSSVDTTSISLHL